MKYGQAFILFALTAPAMALSQDAGKYQCTQGDLVRRVEIYTEPGKTVPCEVHYFKDTEAPGEDQVLWSASQQAGYCEEKAAGLVAGLEQSGWDCRPTDPGAPAAQRLTPDLDGLGKIEPRQVATNPCLVFVRGYVTRHLGSAEQAGREESVVGGPGRSLAVNVHVVCGQRPQRIFDPRETYG